MPAPNVPAGFQPHPALRDEPLPQWPAAERPRERLSALGARALSECELLALLLRTGGAGRGALGLARALQDLAGRRGGFEHMEEADLRAVPGMGPAKASAVLAAREWGRRLAQAGPGEAPLRDARDACAALRALLDDPQREHVAVLALDSRRRVKACEVVSSGTLTQSLAHPREVFRSAVKLGAAAVVVGHNHPSGDPAPSADDHAMTRRMREAADILGIPLLDHLILGRERFHSYAESGWDLR